VDDGAASGAHVAGSIGDSFTGCREFLTRRKRAAGRIQPGSHNSRRVEIKAVAAPGRAGLTEHAQVQRYGAKEKEYCHEVLFQGSPNRKRDKRLWSTF
jgi:hypothetical protein